MVNALAAISDDRLAHLTRMSTWRSPVDAHVDVDMALR